MELKNRQSIYEWGDDNAYKDLPGYLKATDVNSLPKDVQFTQEAMHDLHKARRAALLNLGLVKLFNLFTKWDDFDDFRKVMRDCAIIARKWRGRLKNERRAPCNLIA